MSEDIDIVEIDYVLLDTWHDRQRANERLAAGWRLIDGAVGEGDHGIVEGRVLLGRPSSVKPYPMTGSDAAFGVHPAGVAS